MVASSPKNLNIEGATPLGESPEIWRCFCGRPRANPYGRPTFERRVRLEGCGTCGDLVIVGTNYDAAVAIKTIIDRNIP